MLLISFLMACGADAADSGNEEFDAAAEYSSNCAGCHNADGTGGVDIGGTPSADLTTRVPAMTDEELTAVFNDGLNGVMPAQFDGDAAMTSGMIEYLRETFP
jgi:mono/diheme cytochrome c family protein